jgi:rod shape-determining protein MreC
MQQIFNLYSKQYRLLLFAVIMHFLLPFVYPISFYHRVKWLVLPILVWRCLSTNKWDVSEYLNWGKPKRSISSWKCKIEKVFYSTLKILVLKKEWFYKRESLLMIFYSIESNYNSYNVHENFLTLNSGSTMELNKIM